MFLEEFRGNRELAEESYVDLSVGYVLISGYYFLLDSVVDGHCAEPTSAVFLTHLLGGAMLRFNRLIQRENPSAAADWFTAFSDYCEANAEAVRLEKKLISTPMKLNPEDDRLSIVGRSNSFLLLYRLVCILHREESSAEVARALEALVYYLQLGDDLGDWREDFLAGNYSSTLRACFLECGRVLDLRSLEEFLYLSGFYEVRCIEIIRGLAECGLILEKLLPFSTRLRNLALSQKEVIQAATELWVTEKLRQGSVT